MRVDIDSERCCGYGECELVAPGVFIVSRDGKSSFDPAAATDRELVQRAAAACPVRAIAVVE